MSDLITDVRDPRFEISGYRDMSVHEILLRDSLRAALAAKEKAEGALCSMREALETIEDVDKSPVYGEVHVLRMIARRALSSSAPCPCAEREKRLQDAVMCLYAHCNKTERENFREEFKDVDAILRRRLAGSAG